MLKALYAYSIENGLTLPPGYANKTIKAYISLDNAGNFLGLALGDDQNVACPDIGSLANGPSKCHVLVEKASIILADEHNAKTDFFLSTLQDGSKQIPAFQVCFRALSDAETRQKIKEALHVERIKPADRVSFRVDGVPLPYLPETATWWSSYRRQFLQGGGEVRTVCLITGAPTAPLRTVPSVKGLRSVGGHASGDVLICFDKSAFCSYGLKQAANAPVSEEAMAGVNAALEVLIAKAPTLAGMKFIHWYDKPLPLLDDPVAKLFVGSFDLGSGEDEKTEDDSVPDADNEQERLVAQIGADRLVMSVESGQEAPPLAHVYYILLLSAVSGRVMVRRWDHGSYEQLYASLAQWQEDIALAARGGEGLVKPHKLSAMLIRLLSRQTTDNNIFDRMASELAGVTPQIIHAILTDSILPDAVASRALAYIRSQMMDTTDELKAPPLPDDMCCQWLKAWLLRRARNKKEEVFLMPEYNPKSPNPAYHCGAIMAVYADIQKTAMPDVNAGVIQRYYAAASQTPAMVIGQLARLSNYHQSKIESGWLIKLYEELLNNAYVALGDVVPVTLNLEEQAYFALGYRQMAKEIYQRRSYKKGQAAKDPEQTTSEKEQ